LILVKAATGVGREPVRHPEGFAMSSRPWLSIFALAALGIPVCAAAGEPAVAPTARLEWNARLRHEHVDDAAFAHAADAPTLRLRGGLRFAWSGHWNALLEGEAIAADDGHYSSGANGRTAWPSVIDAPGAELNQAWLGWQGTQAKAVLGRQRLLLDNQRWLGNSGWRQNEQTFDALALEWKAILGLTTRVQWFDRVHRVAGDDARDPLVRERDLDGVLLNVALPRGDQQWVAYGYWHQDRDVAAASTATHGLRWSGNRITDGRGWGWTLEAATQRDLGDNPVRFEHAYWLLEPTLTRHGVTWRAGWEHLGGNGRHALQTPLATLHAFNGWADKFNVTPPGGLEDRYLGAGGKFGRGTQAGRYAWAIAWHEYRADRGGRYGDEWNASLGFPLRGPVTGLVKLADYRSDGFARDTTKLWLQLEWMRP
jgi:hypothetical protein